MKSIPFGKPIIGDEEKNAVLDVLNGTVLAHGKKLKEFEAGFAAYAKAPAATTVANCTAAMHLAYFCLGLKPGDEVIVPAQTHTATAHAVELASGKAVFVDAESDTGNIDIDQIECAITDRTKAISVVHFLGMPVDMGRINALAKKRGLFVLEDCALAIGTKFDGIHAGLLGDIGCFSFYPVKHITTAEGGMAISNDPSIIHEIDRKKAFGLDKMLGERKVPGMYDVNSLGFNYRMNEIQAAIGVEQVKRIDGFLQKRRSNYERLSEGLKQIDEVELLKSSHDKFESSYYCHTAILKEDMADKRIQIIENLKANGVGTSIYYPNPVPLMKYYKEKYAFKDGMFPVASKISNNSIALSVGPHLDGEDMDYIVEMLKNAIMETK